MRASLPARPRHHGHRLDCFGEIAFLTVVLEPFRLRLGIARALVEADGQHRAKLRAAGLMTRDPRAVERKKPGRPGARKRFQFSKR